MVVSGIDETGAPVIIDVERSGFGGEALRLDVEELVANG